MVKDISIKKVKNGYTVDITSDGNQSPYDSFETYIADGKDQVIEIVKENLEYLND
jgi:hypothetical protein